MQSVASVSPTGDTSIDAVLSGIKWATNSLTFSFPTDPSFYGTSYGSGENQSGFEAFTAQQQSAIRSILSNYSSVINFTFTEVTETSTQHGDLRYAESDVPSTAWAYYPSFSALGGDAWFNNSKNWYDLPVMGNYAWFAMIHETGHAMGLKHPHTAQGSFPAMPVEHDSIEYSVMSYRSYAGGPTGGYTASDYPQTLMMYDIAALQEMYGADYTTQSGDTVYRWDPLTGREYINGVAQAAPGANKIFMTLWDGGGNDTYDFSNYTTHLSVNLQPGAWTTVSAAQLAALGAGHSAAGNIANALLYHGNLASLIENAVGGSGHDTIIGNVAANRLTGGAGNDTLDGDAGADTAVYSGYSYQYQLIQNANGSWTVTDLRGGAPDGVDTLTNIEFLQFTDMLLSLDGLQTPPTVPTPAITSFSNDSNLVGDGITNDNTLTLSGTAAANSLVKVYDGATLLGSVTANASGAWSFTTAALADGGHSFTATATNAAGQVSAVSAAFIVTVDTLAPAAPTIATFSTDTGVVGDRVTSDNTLTLTGTAAAASTVKVYDGATLVGTAVANSSGAWSITTAALGNGVHSFTATATDVAGNVSAASAAFAVTVNTSAVAAPTITAFSADTGIVGDRVTADNTLTLSGTAAANSVVKVYDGSTLLGSVMANASGAWTLTTAALNDGTHVFTAMAAVTDKAAGQVSAMSAAFTVTVDTVAPTAPVIAAFSTDTGVVGDRITSDNTLTLSGTAAAASTVKVYDGATLLGSVTANASGAWSFTTAALADGGHSFTATATDAAGNVSAASAAFAVTVNTSAVAAPTIATFSTDTGVIGDRVTADNTLTLTGTAAANSVVKVYDGATLLGSVTANASGAWSFTTAALADGGHSFTATATNAAGQVSAVSAAFTVTVDTVAPAAPVIAAFSTDTGVIGDRITSDNTLALSGTAAASSLVKVYDGSTLLGSVTANASGAWSFTTAALADGGHSFTATATDVAGNVSAASAAFAVTVNTSAVAVPTIVTFSTDTGVVGDRITSDNTLMLTGTAAANSVVKVYDDATLLGTVTASASGAWSFTTAALADGGHSFTATATDAAGNVSAASAAFAVTVDTAAPSQPAISSFSADTGVIGDGITSDNTLSLSGVAAAGTVVKVYDGSVLLGSAVAASSGLWNFTTPALADGDHAFRATATDAAGNVSAASEAFAVTVDTLAPAAPTIATFSTDTGVIGDRITSDNTLLLSGAAAAGSVVKVYDGSLLLGSAVANTSGTWTYSTPALDNALHNFTATATDAAGNVSSPSANFAVTVTAVTTTSSKPGGTYVLKSTGSAANEPSHGGTTDMALTLSEEGAFLFVAADDPGAQADPHHHDDNLPADLSLQKLEYYFTPVINYDVGSIPGTDEHSDAHHTPTGVWLKYLTDSVLH